MFVLRKLDRFIVSASRLQSKVLDQNSIRILCLVKLRIFHLTVLPIPQRLAKVHHKVLNPQTITFAQKFTTIKMSDIEMEIPKVDKKFANAQTQHSKPELEADEESIVVLTTSFSPAREESEEVVWHEEFFIEEVSSSFLI